MEDAPYPRFTLAVTESLTPGGHSPPYLAAYSQPLPGVPITWTRDPTAFENYPEFFLAHELAHQWWGHAVGWQNYHEQWLSEGFSQYFAALYAERRRGPSVFASIIRQMSEWAVKTSPQGPVYLGYRLGHLKNDSRVLRALLYNKGAMVLHMLRRLTGDEAFFRALRRFYADHRFTKAGTDQLRRAFEAETGQPLERFFERWIYGWTLPALSYSSQVVEGQDGPTLLLRFTQRDQVFDFPLTITLLMKDRTTRDVVVPIRERTVEHRIPLDGELSRVDVNRDGAALLADD
jgi:aminopeptidase N